MGVQIWKLRFSSFIHLKLLNFFSQELFKECNYQLISRNDGRVNLSSFRQISEIIREIYREIVTNRSRKRIYLHIICVLYYGPTTWHIAGVSDVIGHYKENFHKTIFLLNIGLGSCQFHAFLVHFEFNHKS